MPSIIDYYQSDVWNGAGDTLADHAQMAGAFKTGLLHLVYYLLYTQAGRQYMHAWIPGVNGRTDADVRAELAQRFQQEFGVTGAAQEAMIGAHIAGFAWIAANNANNAVDRDKQEAIYKQNVAAVSWFLWEEGSGKLFSLGW